MSSAGADSAPVARPVSDRRLWGRRRVAAVLVITALIAGAVTGASHAPDAAAQTAGVTTNGPYAAAVGQPILMTGNLTLPGLVPTQWIWNFGDGTTRAGQSVQKSYTVAGTYFITLQVQTSQGILSATTTATITQSGSGSVSAGGPYSGTVGQTIVMRGSVGLLGVNPTQWFWTFGDGTTGTGQTVQKAYSTPGTYTINLQVQTGQGILSATTTATITGQSGSGTISAGGPYSGTVGQPIAMSGSVLVGGVFPTQWLWSFGDGTTASGQSVQKTYNAAGTYTVTLQAQTSQGLITATTTATVSGASAVTESISLTSGCTNVAVTWPNQTPIATVMSAVAPATALAGVWRYDSATQRFLGAAPGTSQAVNDLASVNFFEAIFICTNAPAMLSRPAR